MPLPGSDLTTLVDASIKLDAAAADAKVWSELAYTKILQPVIDGVQMRQPPAAQLAAGASKDVPILIGSNDEEFRLYLVPGGAIDRIPEPAVAGMVATLKLPAEMPAVYRVSRPNATPGEVFSAINSDYVFRNAAHAQALAHAKAAARRPTPTSSAGVRRNSAAGSVPRMCSTCHSYSTRCARRRPWVSSAPRRRRNSPRACMPPGWPLRRPANRAGKPTTMPGAP